MKIVKSNADNKLEQIQNNRDFISSVIDEIFLICREDDSFIEARKKVEILDLELNKVLDKLESQNTLLEKANILKADITKKLTILENENENVKIELLRKMGSAL